jgi:acyl-CoA thioesterase-1
MHKNLLLVCGALLCFAITACTKADVEPNPLLLASNNLTLGLSATPKNNIVILGGSTAWGKGATSVENTWVYLLQSKLKAIDKNDTVINLAFPGYTTYHIMANDFVPAGAKRPEADTLRNITTALSKHPMLVIISLPSNDIANGYNDAEIISNYKTVVNTLIREKIPYFLTSNQPRDFNLGDRLRLRTFTDLLVKTFPGHVIDYLNKLGDALWEYKAVYNCGDGIHPNNKGHQVIYNSFITYDPFKKAVGIK